MKWITVKIKLRNFWPNLSAPLLVLVTVEPMKEKKFSEDSNVFSIISQ